MSSQILIAMDDLETAVRLNAAFEAAKFSTAMFSSLDDARGSVRDGLDVLAELVEHAVELVRGEKTGQ